MFWTAAAFAGVLKAYVRERGEPGFGSLVSLSDWQCRRTVLRTGDGEQHLLLRDHTHIIQVLCRGADLTRDPFALELVVDQFPEVEGRLPLLKAFADLYRRRRIAGVDPGGEALLVAAGAARVKRALEQIDALEAVGFEAAAVSPAYLRHLHNRIATGRPARAYSQAQHAAWLAARRIGR